MPISYKILPGQMITYVHYTGIIDADDVVRAANANAEDPNFAPGAIELIDLREIDEFDMSYRTMSNMIYRLGKQHDLHGPPAEELLLADNDVAFGMARMFESIVELAGGPPVTVVRSEAEALLRLGRPERSVAELLAGPHQPRTRVQA